MIKIITGGFASDLDARINGAVLRVANAGARGFLIVPEQQTVTAERWVSKNLPHDAPLYFEATNFTRLADTAFRALGGLGTERLTSGKQALVMWRTLTELSGHTAYAASSKRCVGAASVKRQIAAVKEMRSLAISPEELAAAAQSERILGEGKLKSKLSDLSLIMTLYKSLLGERYTDSSDELSLLERKLAENPYYLSGYEIFFKDFTSFTEEQYRIISRLAERCNLTVSLLLPKSERDFFEYTETKNTRERLVRIGAKADTAVTFEEASADLPTPISEAARLLWRSEGEMSDVDIGEAIRIFEARNPYEELSFVASDISRRVREGASYSDFAVVMRSTEGYGAVLESAFADARLPLFISKRRDLSSFEAIKLIYTAFAVLRDGFKRGDVISYIKCGLSGVSREACDEFEMYVEKWQISGRRFTDGVIWNMNPDGYTDRKRHGADELLVRINETRASVIAPLISLSEKVSVKRTVRHFATSLVEFLTEIGLEGSLKLRASELSASGDVTGAKETLSLIRLIYKALDDLVELLGEMEVGVEGFLELIKIILEDADIGRIPAFTDEVIAGSADMIRLFGKRHIYLVGVNYGHFPASVGESSYFTEKDRALLSSIGLTIEPELETKSARELFIFSRAFSAAKESVTLTFADSDLAFSPISRAEVIDRLCEVSCGRLAVKRISDIPVRDRIYSRSAALSLLGEAEGDRESIKRALESSGEDELLRVSEGSATNESLTLTEDALTALYRADLSLTQSRIDTYKSCPLSYFCKYNLNLSEGERAEFNAMNVGTFIHAILEKFLADAKAAGKRISDMDEGERKRVVSEVAKRHLDSLADSLEVHDARLSVMLKRLERAAMPIVDNLCNEFKDSKFEPSFFELKIESGNPASPAPSVFKSGDTTALVYGTIDRVDTFCHGDDVYVRVVDYKTGSKVFSPSDIEEGKNLQMFLYLKSITETDNEQFRRSLGAKEGGRVLPAGVVYMNAAIADAKVDSPNAESQRAAISAAQKRSGMILYDPVSISAMNPDYLPVSFKKDGEPYASSKARLYTLDGWGELCKTLSDVVGDIAENIRHGDISAKPMKSKSFSPCERCAMKPICRNTHRK
ncbi:MAG: PD-(D/E)XK nuclease family protein [Clostridia bacterium]|nr:PD-(D/E)XK nuclease family protein [Clostridia bacterium]